MKMQINTPPQLAAEIARLSARMIAAGVKRQQARPGKIYRKLVEYGVERWVKDEVSPYEILDKEITGGRGNQIDFAPATRQEIWTVAGQLGMKQVEAANACAWWGLEAFTQYVHALEASYTPKEKRSVGRPRKYESAS